MVTCLSKRDWWGSKFGVFSIVFSMRRLPKRIQMASCQGLTVANELVEM